MAKEKQPRRKARPATDDTEATAAAALPDAPRDSYADESTPAADSNSRARAEGLDDALKARRDDEYGEVF